MKGDGLKVNLYDILESAEREILWTIRLSAMALVI